MLLIGGCFGFVVCELLAVGCPLLVDACWLLGNWLSISGCCWFLVGGGRFVAAVCWFAGFWMLVAGCWWLLVVGC